MRMVEPQGARLQVVALTRVQNLQRHHDHPTRLLHRIPQ
jgi:hypothetical protein